MRLQKGYGKHQTSSGSGNFMVDDLQSESIHTPRASKKEMLRREADFWEQQHKQRCPACGKYYHYAGDKEKECQC
jgi:hypothetical protein